MKNLISLLARIESKFSTFFLF